jgi:hypothetical protein
MVAKDAEHDSAASSFLTRLTRLTATRLINGSIQQEKALLRLDERSAEEGDI